MSLCHIARLAHLHLNFLWWFCFTLSMCSLFALISLCKGLLAFRSLKMTFFFLPSYLIFPQQALWIYHLRILWSCNVILILWYGFIDGYPVTVKVHISLMLRLILAYCSGSICWPSLMMVSAAVVSGWQGTTKEGANLTQASTAAESRDHFTHTQVMCIYSYPVLLGGALAGSLSLNDFACKLGDSVCFLDTKCPYFSHQHMLSYVCHICMAALVYFSVHSMCIYADATEISLT